jgi:thioredoxin-like negative regulator of GroEL
MKIYYFVAYFILFTAQSLLGQSSIETLLSEGIEAHDKGEYKNAVELYKQALKIDSKAAILFYELSLSYYHLKDYKNAIKFADKSLKSGADKEILLSTYLIKGAAVDDMNGSKAKKTVKVYQDAINVFPEDYLLQYNLAFRYYKSKDYKNAEKALAKAITLNPFHASSHFLLGQNCLQQNLRIQSIMAFSQFLFLENLEHPLSTTERSKNGFTILKEQALGNITRVSETSININLTVNEEDEFNVLNTIMSLMTAQNRVEADSLNLTENQQMERFYSTLAKMISENGIDESSFWGKHYASFLKQLKTNEITAPYAYVILLSNKDDMVIDWININMDEIGKVEDLLLKHTEAIKNED